jgi:ubiquinol-cytochrome c reductase cytochrome b subunit
VSLRKHHPLLKIVNGLVIDLPAPVNLSVKWNYGSLLGLVLVMQIVTGLVLAMRFSAHDTLSFSCVI